MAFTDQMDSTTVQQVNLAHWADQLDAAVSTLRQYLDGLDGGVPEEAKQIPGACSLNENFSNLLTEIQGANRRLGDICQRVGRRV